MANEPLIIDTSALIEKGFLQWCRKSRALKILPIIAYCEFSVGNLKRGKTQDEIDSSLRYAGIEIRNMTPVEAKNTALICDGLIDADWRKDWRDYMIGSYAFNPPHLVVTKNVRDFNFLGDRVVDPVDLMHPKPGRPR